MSTAMFESGVMLASPNVPGLPAPVSGDFFTGAQWAVLIALFDTVAPAIVPESEVTDNKAHKGLPDAEYQKLVDSNKGVVANADGDNSLLLSYLQDRPSSHPEFVYACRKTLASVPAPSRKQLGAVLSHLATRAGSFLWTGYTTPINEQPVAVREAILQSWATSWFGPRRVLFKTFTSLAQTAWVQTNPLMGPVSGFPDVPQDWKPGPQFDFSFVQFEAGPADEPVVLEADVVIVGSGCGGGVCAKTLAEAGHRVVVVDKGYHFSPSQLPMPQIQASHHLFENGGALPSADGSINLIAGSCWGGGGSINWSVALQTQGYVRREWAEDHALPLFATQEFQDCLDRVCGFMGVGDPAALRHNHRSQALLEGSRRLGWESRPAPQNTGGKDHWCGHCHLGCAGAEKQGPAVSWLPAAARAGAQFVEGFHVDKVLFDGSSKRKVATGVTGQWTSRDRQGGVVGPADERVSRKVVIKAKKVIVSAGSLHTPLILRKSGLKNRHIGENLHVHPVNFLSAYYDDEVRPWEGSAITSLCSSFENLDNNGHGPKLEATCMVPYMIFSSRPWRGGLDFKLAVARYRRMASFISLNRDRDGGRVYAHPSTGKPIVAYTPSAFDAANTLEGVIALAKICYITGATEIHPYVANVEPFVRNKRPSNSAEETPSTTGTAESVAKDNGQSNGDSDPSASIGPDGRPMDLGVSDPAFVAWLSRLRATGNAPPSPFGSAHQMGSCRMGSHEGAGAVDPRGRTWEAEGLFVADASVFPSASGVNPMVTNMAIADWIARGVVGELAGEKK